MRPGTMRVAGVFLGVLVATGGLGFLLYEAGKTSAEPSPIDTESRPRESRRRPERSVNSPDVAPVRPPSKDPAAKPRFTFPDREDIDRRDWIETAKAFLGFIESLRDFAETADPTRPLPPEKEATTKKAMGRWGDAISTVASEQQPLSRIPMEDPAFLVNLVPAVLDHLKLPLSAEQHERLGEIARKHIPLVAAAAPSRLPEDPRVYRLDVVADRAQALAAFGDEAQKVLTPAQHAALVPEYHRGRLNLDIFSGSAPIATAMIHVPYTDTSEIVDVIVHDLSHAFRVVDRKDEVRAIVESWVAAWNYPIPDEREWRGGLFASRILNDVRRGSQLLHRLVEEMKLNEAAAALAREMRSAYVPRRRIR
jgi:hypothetical protein